MARLGPTFAGGTGMVDLTSMREPSLVLERVATALDVPEGGVVDPMSRLVPALLGRRLLVLLDNFEHLLGAAGSVADLVAQCPDLVVLVTSRAPLRVRSEHEVPLQPLPVPTRDSYEDVLASAAGQLFLDRTSAAGRGVELDTENAAAIAEICRRLDGLPLALELAAAGARLLTPSALLARLDELERTPGPRDLAERQRTMTAALDWSLDLLGPEQVELFGRLATFSDGFRLDAAAAVAADDDLLGSLGVLVEHSLVARTGSPDDQPRFRLLEPVRQYAARRLVSSGEAAAVADRHASWFRDRALAASPLLHGAGLVEELDRLEAEHANLRSAYLRLLELDRVGDAVEMAGSLWLYLALRGHAREGLAWLAREDEAASEAARCRAMTGRMGLLFATGEIARMRQDAAAVVPLARRIDDADLAAEALTLAGHAAVFVGDLDGARQVLEDALARAQGAGSTWVTAHALVALGQLALVGAEHEEADRVLGRALETARGLGNSFTLATCLTRRATVTALRGDDVSTAALLGESIVLSVKGRMSWTLSYALPSLAGVALRLGEADTAASLFGASASLSAADAVDPRFPVSRDLADQDLAAARHRLGARAFRDAWDAGRAASQEEVAELASELTRLALA
jgi:predicted ATPase